MGVLSVTRPPPRPARTLCLSCTDVAGCPRGPRHTAQEGRQGRNTAFTLPARPPWAPSRPPLGLAPLGPGRPGQLRVSPLESLGTKASLCSAGCGASSLQLVRPSGLSAALSPRPQAGLTRGASGKGRRGGASEAPGQQCRPRPARPWRQPSSDRPEAARGIHNL